MQDLRARNGGLWGLQASQDQLERHERVEREERQQKKLGTRASIQTQRLIILTLMQSLCMAFAGMCLEERLASNPELDEGEAHRLAKLMTERMRTYVGRKKVEELASDCSEGAGRCHERSMANYHPTSSLDPRVLIILITAAVCQHATRQPLGFGSLHAPPAWAPSHISGLLLACTAANQRPGGARVGPSTAAWMGGENRCGEAKEDGRTHRPTDRLATNTKHPTDGDERMTRCCRMPTEKR
ncbi:unnamed protein product [Vitrella brassicaformis CCMP3155]|uniref:Uncharacterized protein n=1 Tax=Vitrella brassicaformis (strain CCMP3155) TaxID=1169540 RepID=A0A0G4FXN6_VITBC|nr:unnamed protein product [Vitrella brassicaformis CCMP3155]|eukprot:CEM20076.1 unnamed protein product [Vitrella brassicaformis CCMP3155]